MCSLYSSNLLMESTESRKYIQLAWLCWAFCLNGFNNGIIGPSLPDLAENIDQHINEINVILPTTSAGNFFGILISSTCLKSKSLYLFITVSLLLGAISTFFIPLAGNLTNTLILFFLQGLSKGLVDAYCYALCLCLFPSNHNWQMLSLPVASAFSGLTVAFIVKAFQSHLIIYSHANITSISECTEDTCYMTPNRISYPYMIVSLILVPPILAFFYYFIADLLKKVKRVDYTVILDLPSVRSIYLKDKLAFIILIFFFHIPVYGSIITYSHLLTLYGISSPLFQSKSVMATITALFWGSVLLGRITNVCLSRYISMQLLLTLNFVGLVIFSTTLFFFKFDIVYIWVGSLGYGFFQSSFLPSVMTWAGSFLELDVIILYTSLIANGVGEIVIPYTAVLMFQHISHKVLMLLIFILSLIELGLFLAICYLKRVHNNKNNT
ncbi:sodium-dependent glucose transporter 1A-like [Octopus sinensis]|uniref:Sodium-dependent glucose transporter 1A-like n=1 Tax=Octopus sinensis TaxID=2607531 RepID=A0A7E6ESG6_9MOLL|nr:sodium-dependent glucose transporter 1A-like [Octopus sinensis]XP_036357703.1 sodium-dependent glucose transporter 1A-like [Octopus sinensis]XP_036357704.1 sodium-dependent glucose transporter 1A-like [Octopus sinensis]